MNSWVCVDANIIIWSLIPAPLSEQAEIALSRWRREHATLIAPALLAFEVTSVLRRLVYLNEITLEEGEEAFKKFLRLDVRLSHRRDILSLAWRFAKEFNFPRAYDAAYLALAQLYGCEFWTGDKRLYNTVKDELKWVRWLGDISADS